MAWSIVVPVKRPELAKTRLADTAGARRPDLARAFAADTVAAALASSAVSRVIVVTDDETAAAELRGIGADIFADAPDSGLNAALRHGADAAREADYDIPVAAISADLPSLRPAELDLALEAAAGHNTSFVADTAGIGTTLYAVASAVPFLPRFGGRSRAAHRVAGAVELELPDIPSVRRDVDTGVDLWDALRLGVGPRTKEIAAQLE